MQNIILNLTKSFKENSNAPKLLIGSGEDSTYLCVIMTADRGLCGGFNTNICKLAKRKNERVLSNGKKIKIITVGSKGYDQLKKEFNKFIIEKNLLRIKKISFNDAALIGKRIVELFEKNEFDKCIIFYNNFKNVITQIPQAQQIIPAKIDRVETKSAENEEFYEFEPEEDEILEDLLPKNISTQIFKAFLENSASEQGSRMTAMDNATRNAGDLVDKLTINYNRSRQASITKELIEIISGAESL